MKRNLARLGGSMIMRAMGRVAWRQVVETVVKKEYGGEENKHRGQESMPARLMGHGGEQHQS